MAKAFECKMCGQCCYGEGGIFITQEEIKRISDFLGLAEHIFLKKYTEIRLGKNSIKTGPDGYCIFFKEGKGCLIHPVKPKPCADWPFYPANLKDPESWHLAKDACPGINPECSFEEFVRQAKK